MITRYDFDRFSKKEDCWFEVREDGVYDKEKNIKYIDTVEEFIRFMNKVNHSLFTCIHHDHASLDTVYKCEECGAIIFTGDDERYNPNLRCPVCSGTDQGCEFWTAEEVAADEKKQNTLKFYEEWKEAEQRDYERKKKTGLYHDEIWKKEVKNRKTGKCKKKYVLKWMNSKYFKSNKRSYGLYLEINHMEEDEDGWLYYGKTTKIPLSFYAWKILRRIRKKYKVKKNEKD